MCGSKRMLVLCLGKWMEKPTRLVSVRNGRDNEGSMGPNELDREIFCSRSG